MERHNSRLSDVSFTMDRTSFADLDRLTVLVGEPEGLKRELTLEIIESFPYDSNNIISEVFVVNASPKLDILCLHEHPSQVLHLYHLSRRSSGIPAFKEKYRIPALSAAPIIVHKSQRLLILSSDLILRIHSPWHTRLNIVVPSTRSWRSISQVNGNRFTLIDTKSQTQRYHLDLIPQHRLIAWCLDILECILDSSFYSLFLSVYGIARLKSNSSDMAAFVITLFACFSALNTRSPSPSPRPSSDMKIDNDPWQNLHSTIDKEVRFTTIQRNQPFTPLTVLPQARELVHHFEGVQRPYHLTMILFALHALSEELRLHIGMADQNKTLVPILCQLAYWLGRTSFVEYYVTSDVEFEAISFDRLPFSGIRDVSLAKQEPWSIYKWLISCVHVAVPRVHQDELLTLDVLLFKAFPRKPRLPIKLVKLRDYYLRSISFEMSTPYSIFAISATLSSMPWRKTQLQRLGSIVCPSALLILSKSLFPFVNVNRSPPGLSPYTVLSIAKILSNSYDCTCIIQAPRHPSSRYKNKLKMWGPSQKFVKK